jgi:hypothetical protein
MNLSSLKAEIARLKVERSGVHVFSNPYEMATWIQQNIEDELLKEQLMFKGVQHKQVNGTYQITVESDE